MKPRNAGRSRGLPARVWRWSTIVLALVAAALLASTPPGGAGGWETVVPIVLAGLLIGAFGEPAALVLGLVLLLLAGWAALRATILPAVPDQPYQRFFGGGVPGATHYAGCVLLVLLVLSTALALVRRSRHSHRSRRSATPPPATPVRSTPPSGGPVPTAVPPVPGSGRLRLFRRYRRPLALTVLSVLPALVVAGAAGYGWHAALTARAAGAGLDHTTTAAAADLRAPVTGPAGGGRQLWSSPAGPTGATLVPGTGLVVAVPVNGAGVLVSDAGTGRERWHYRFTPAWTGSVAVSRSASAVLVLTDGTVTVLDLRTGGLLRRFPLVDTWDVPLRGKDVRFLPTSPDDAQPGPVVFAGKAYLSAPADDQAVLALDPAGSATVLAQGADCPYAFVPGDGGAGPDGYLVQNGNPCGDPLALGVRDGRVVSKTPLTGLATSAPPGAAGSGAAGPCAGPRLVVSGDTLVTAGCGEVRAYRNGRTAWQAALPAPDQPAPAAGRTVPPAARPVPGQSGPATERPVPVLTALPGGRVLAQPVAGGPGTLYRADTGAATAANPPGRPLPDVVTANGWYRLGTDPAGRVVLLDLDPGTLTPIGPPGTPVSCPVPDRMSASAGTVVLTCGQDQDQAVAVGG